MTIRWGVLLTLLGCAATAGAAETGYVLRATDLKARPYLDASTIVKLPEKTPVEVLLRQGPWMEVKAQGTQGYVRMLQVRLDVGAAPAARSGSASTARAVVGAVNRPAGASPTVTTGVRGFDEEGLKQAEPAPAEFEKMAGYAVDAAQARQFAQQTQLTARALPYYADDGKPLEEGKR